MINSEFSLIKIIVFNLVFLDSYIINNQSWFNFNCQNSIAKSICILNFEVFSINQLQLLCHLYIQNYFWLYNLFAIVIYFFFAKMKKI